MIDLDSILYRKRLVRELNGLTDGFYASVATFNVRCNRARMRAGQIEVRGMREAVSPQWFTPAKELFTDVYGCGVCASRKG